MHRLGGLLLCVLISISSHGQSHIGLTLSGGGAKGLVHIGILEAIDSAELNIDYVTGTSMGSIMGALYAAGYSGKEMERIARQLDWANLFSGKPLFEHVNVDEKSEFDQYALEVPFEHGKFKLSTGVIEGQEIWLKFQELFLPVYNIKDFSKLSIPFKCIATDVSTGKAVVLDRGEIVTAIRASMAIPSIFTAIDYKDTKLVDGGVVRNFPVRDVIDMGANYAIGVNLSQGLLKADKLNSAIDILYQIAFYKDAEDFQHERKLCNVLIEPRLDDFSAASFGSSDELIQIGKDWGKKFYPVFKKLADSLKANDPNYHFRKERLPQQTKVAIDKVEINGLQNTSQSSFIKRLHVEVGKEYDGMEVASAIRRVYGSRSYSRISYHWEPTSKDHAKLVFDVIENPSTYFKVGLHYHTFSSVALLTTVASKNLLFDRSKSLLKLNIGENFRAMAEQNQTFGKQDNNNLIFSVYYENFKFPIYKNYEQTYLYRDHFSRFDLQVQHTFGQRSALGLGTSFENFGLKPEFSGGVDVEAANKYWHSYVYYELNTLNQKHFTTSGWRIYARLGEVYHQRPDKLFYAVGSESGIIDTLSFQSYGQLRLNIEHYKAVSSRLTLITQINSGLNLKQNQSFLNFFNVGGLNDFLRNQITFAGLNEFQVRTNSVAVFQLGLQYNPYTNLYTTLRANAGLHDFSYEWTNIVNSGSFISGYSFTVGYASVLGPIQISTMYNDQSGKFSGYVNIGFHF